MSYNYEINYNVQKRKTDNSKYTYKNNEIDAQTYIFELALKDKFNEIHIIRRIKKCNQGNLICAEDNILYNMINKYKLTVLDINYPEKPIIVKEVVNHNLSNTIFPTPPNKCFLLPVLFILTQSVNASGLLINTLLYALLLNVSSYICMTFLDGFLEI